MPKITNIYHKHQKAPKKASNTTNHPGQHKSKPPRHLVSITMTTTKKNENVLVRMWRNRKARALLRGMQNGAAALEKYLAIPQRIKELSYDPASLLGEKWKLNVYIKTCTLTFIQHIIIIMAKRWKQSKGPSTDEQLNKMWYILTLEYYSATKRNELLIHDIIW